MVINSVTFIYYLNVEISCLAIVVLVIHAAPPVHAKVAAEIQIEPTIRRLSRHEALCLLMQSSYRGVDFHAFRTLFTPLQIEDGSDREQSYRFQTRRGVATTILRLHSS